MFPIAICICFILQTIWADLLLLYYFCWELPARMAPEDVDMSVKYGVTITRRSSLLVLRLAV